MTHPEPPSPEEQAPPLTAWTVRQVVVAAGLGSVIAGVAALAAVHAWWPDSASSGALLRELLTAVAVGVGSTAVGAWAVGRVFQGQAASAAAPSTPLRTLAPSVPLTELSAVHQALANSRTQVILNAIPDVLVGLDDQGHIALSNPALASVFGMTPDEALGRSITDIVPALNASVMAQLARDGLFIRSTNAHVARLETNARRFDGTEFPAEVSLARVDNPTGAMYALVLRDLTEQRMANEMLGLYNRALECATNGVVISDMRLANQPVFYANPAFERITGYSLMEIIGRNLMLLQGEDTKQPELATLATAQSLGESASAVLRSYRKDGTLFFNEVSIAPVKAEDGSIPHYVCVLSDVTERERSRMALAERNARLNAVFDLSPDGFVVFDRDGELVYSNKAFRDMTGWSSEAAGHMTVHSFDAAFGPMCDPAIPYRPIAEAMDDTVGHAAPEIIRMVTPAHRAVARLVRHNVDGRGESILYLRDITQETEVDRMKSEFLTTAAHELRTPMVSIFGFTELLLNRPVPDGKKRDLLETIHRQSSLLINMVNELLDLARIEARAGKDLKREEVAIGAVIEQTVAAMMVAGDQRPVALDVQHGQQLLKVDREKTIQALTNILSNAYKYSPEGGEIRLSTVEGRLRDQPALGIQVVDHGIGMTAQQQARVFERFYRADPSGNIPGTGLGMSLVKEIAELQGGQVDLRSELGVGTCVTLWFPLAGASSAASPVSTTGQDG